MKKMNILEVSACGNKKSEQKLHYVGERDMRMVALLKSLFRKKQWHLISVRDISWHALQKLERSLQSHRYTMYMHESWLDVQEKWRYTCLSALFVHWSVDFQAICVYDEMFTTHLRYMAGKVMVEGREIIYKTSHIPCVEEEKAYVEQQIKRKYSMLEAEIKFQEEHQNVLAISAGDFNGDREIECYGKEKFEQFAFTDYVEKSTYEDKKLDHVYISRGLSENPEIMVHVEVLDDYYLQLTDHRIITIELSAEKIV